MNKKDELKLDLLSNIKDEIIDKQSEKRYKLMTKKRRHFPKWIIPTGAAAAILIVALIPILLLLFSKQVPVYEGMTVLENFDGSVQAAPSYSIDMLTNKDNNGNHYGHDKKPIRDIVEDDPTISLTVPEQEMYYADPGQDIYINIHISNPDNFVILSFMLNGKMYSSYMFEEGSDMENIVLKVNVGDTAGVVEYTIDAIKYVDGTEIKDVIMEGDRTVKVGVYSEGIQPEASIENELVGINEISFTASLSDKYSLIERSGGKAYAILFGEDNIIEYKELTAEETEITFDGLDTNTSYRYGIVAYYDSLDGNGLSPQVMFEKEFTTQSVVAIGGVNVDQTSIDFGVIFNEAFESKALSSMTLYHGEEKVQEFDVSGDITQSTFSAAELLSNNTYRLVLTYENLGKAETVEFELTTEAKAEPTFAIKDVVADTYTVSGSYDQTNVDNTLISYKVELYKGDELVKENENKEINFDSLDYYTDYTIKITYTFDVNDGKGMQTKTVEKAIYTAPYVDVKSLSVKNTSTVFTNEYIYLVATLENPVGVTVKTATINGTEYSANGASSGNMLLIDIKNEGQFANGEISLSIESLCVTIDGNDYTIDMTTVCSDTVSVYSRLTILNAEIVNKDLETFDWISMTVNDDETKRFIMITLDGAKSNDIKTIYVSGSGEEGGSELLINFSDVELVDDTRILIPLQDMVYYDRLGLSTFTMTVSCESSYGGSYEVNRELTDIYVVMDVKYISTAEEFINCPRDVYAELTCDLDFSDVSGFEGKYFEGVFNGNGYAMKNVSFTGDYSGKDIGIFTMFNGFLRNLKVENLFMYVSGGNNAAALIAKRGNSIGRDGYAKVENCAIDESSVVSISNVWNCAIFCARADKIDFINCVNYANANLYNPVDYGIPGFVGGGSDNFEFTDCYNYGTITSKGEVFYDPTAQDQTE